MRHFSGLLAGATLTVALLLGGGWASQEVARAVVQHLDPADDGRMLTAFGVLAVVGLLLGGVLAVRMSPLAAFIPSMVLLTWTVVYVLDVTRAIDLAPTAASWNQEMIQAAKGMRTLLSSGVFGLLGIALFVPVLMPSRWAGPLEEDDEDEFED